MAANVLAERRDFAECQNLQQQINDLRSTENPQKPVGFAEQLTRYVELTATVQRKLQIQENLPPTSEDVHRQLESEAPEIINQQQSLQDVQEQLLSSYDRMCRSIAAKHSEMEEKMEAISSRLTALNTKKALLTRLQEEKRNQGVFTVGDKEYKMTEAAAALEQLDSRFESITQCKELCDTAVQQLTTWTEQLASKKKALEEQAVGRRQNVARECDTEEMAAQQLKTSIESVSRLAGVRLLSITGSQVTLEISVPEKSSSLEQSSREAELIVVFGEEARDGSLPISAAKLVLYGYHLVDISDIDHGNDITFLAMQARDRLSNYQTS